MATNALFQESVTKFEFGGFCFFLCVCVLLLLLLLFVFEGTFK